ncbi:MAG: hypothetical protein H7141_11830 [Burkholderiales bacterium]|nr:hypothetical protein [Bacteroidia bacterium]
MKSIDHFLNELNKYIELYDKTDSSISESSIGWHIEHSLKVINQIISVLEKSKPDEYKWRFNFWRTVVLTSGKIPRGRGKAPKTVLPNGIISRAILIQSLNNANLNLVKLDNLDQNAFFLHPYFGLLNLKTTRSFLSIHTNHHLKIIKDIANHSLSISKTQN